ncbi:hypothetical protein DL546_008530 [Coniochaeta pulveracea]|uniref:Cytochrome b5 heme-binding domain-containing protein n=1 Tax=Coniochaeta pulveracea TaxID=177199 RepID=A0A420YIZ4_9PEZI|nr:hypothetical protein DL546_008530 [Coniochaeta pulveracea]
MGWMRLTSVETRAVQPTDHLVEQLNKTSLDVTTTHIEDTNNPNVRIKENYGPVPTSVSDEELLPFIPASVVSAAATSNRHWIVIDNTVYDCTEFITEHPGGQEVLKPFKGTLGVKNKFKERPRFVGLRPWGADYL